MENRINGLRRFLDASHSVYHARAWVEEELKSRGFTELSEADAWSLVPGGQYYVTRGGTALIAFRIPQGSPTGFLMSAAHTDRPCFKLKENYELAGTYTRAAVEGYGGMLMAPWLDRPLSLAGRVFVQTEEGLEEKLIDIDRDLLLIPNVAIHMNRQANDGWKWNPAVDTIALVGSKEAAGKLEKLLEQAAGGKILGRDLYLYVRQSSSVWGVDSEYLSAPALDDLECVWCCAQGFLNAGGSRAVGVLCLLDSEEVGSLSCQGADSSLLLQTLQRICGCLGLELPRMLARSFLVSADNAHAVHPNHPELADPANAPTLGGGVVVKYNASGRYCTDGFSGAVFRRLCQKAGVPVQSYHNRADIPGGSTLGRISLAQVSVSTVDIGLAQLAMHSCYETAAVRDALALEDAMTAYYSATLERRDGIWKFQ